MKKLLAVSLLLVFIGGVFALNFSVGDSAVRTEQTIKKPGELVAIEPACGDIDVPVVEYAVYYPPMIEEDASTGTIVQAVANSPPEISKDEIVRIRADT